MNQTVDLRSDRTGSVPLARPRVLHVTARADFTGGALYAYNLMEGLGNAVDNFIACPADGPLAPRFVQLVGEPHLLPIPERSIDAGALRRFVGFVRHHRIDVLHSHGKGAGVYTRLAGVLTGLPVAHTFHGLHFQHYGRLGRLGYRALERSMSSLSRTVIAGTESEAEVALAQGFAPAAKIKVIRTGLREIPALQSWPPGVPVRVVHFSRFNIQKNFDAMIDLADAAKASGLVGKLRFQIIGDGPARADYEAEVARRGLAELFDFLGVVPDVAKVMAECKALVSTSRWEGLPVAPLEAGQAGLFLALSSIPGHRELVLTRDGAMLFKLGDRAAYADAATRMAQLHDRTDGDAEQAEALREAFNFEDMVQSHVGLYRSLAGARGRRGRRPS